MAFPREAFITQSRSDNHSEAFIAKSLEYIDSLERKNFPVLFSIPHFAIELGMKSDFLKSIIERKYNFYSFFLLRRKNRNLPAREIMAPKEQLKFIQRWINYNILQKAEFNEHIQGFLPGSKISNNARIHEGARYILKVDLLKFFDCITHQQVFELFLRFGYVGNLAWDFANLCTWQHRPPYWESFDESEKKVLQKYIIKNPSVLPQGAPTSPLISNLIASNLDRRIGKMADEIGFKYSRYADDLCISTNDEKKIPSLTILEKIIKNEGFFINPKKVKLLKAGMKQYVTGLSITNKVSVSKQKRRVIFSHLYFANKFGPEAHLKKLKEKGINKTNYQAWLLGHISFHYSVDKEIGQKMYNLYNKVNWTIDYNKNAFETL